MAGKREKPEEIVSKLRQVEVLQGQGATIAEAGHHIGVMQQTFYRPLSAFASQLPAGQWNVSCMAGWDDLRLPRSRSLRRRTSGCVARCLT